MRPAVAGQRARENEGHRDHAVDVDAQHRRGVRVLCDEALIDLPCRVERTNQVSTRRSGITTAKTASLFHCMATPWIEITSVRGMKSGIVWKLGPYTARPMFWRMNETPTAVISGASRGARRRGLYAMRSMTRVHHCKPRHRDEEAPAGVRR